MYCILPVESGCRYRGTVGGKRSVSPSSSHMSKKRKTSDHRKKNKTWPTFQPDISYSPGVPKGSRVIEVIYLVNRELLLSRITYDTCLARQRYAVVSLCFLKSKLIFVMYQ